MVSVLGWGKCRRWAAGEVFKGGLLFLACLAVCPGVKLCTHRRCPWAKSGQPDWQHAESSESEFLLEMAVIPLWDY